MLDKLLKMDSALLTIKAQIVKYKALFEADGEIDAAERAILNALEADAKRIDEKLGKVIVKAKAVATEKPVTTEKTEELAVGEVVATEKVAGGMEELEAVPAMSGDEKGNNPQTMLELEGIMNKLRQSSGKLKSYKEEIIKKMKEHGISLS